MKDYCKILEVNKSASQEVINKVYRTLAKKYHPDSNPENPEEAAEKFKEISEAYEILSDEEKRKEYDAQLDEYYDSQRNANNEDYENLKSYVSDLEDQISNMQQEEQVYSQDSNYQNNNVQSNNTQNTSSQNVNSRAYDVANSKGYQDAINKAYHDSYINTLKSLGYKIHYKKTFKQKVKDFITVVLSIIVFIILFVIAWQFDAVKEIFAPITNILKRIKYLIRFTF